MMAMTTNSSISVKPFGLRNITDPFDEDKTKPDQSSTWPCFRRGGNSLVATPSALRDNEHSPAAIRKTANRFSSKSQQIVENPGFVKLPSLIVAISRDYRHLKALYAKNFAITTRRL
jgi:hypothetical protein